MRVAIPTFGDEVAPRFCYARETVVVTLEGGRETGRTLEHLGDTSYPEKLRLLQRLGVEMLVCGGFNRAFLAEAEREGIHVLWGVTGAVDAAIRALGSGTLVAHPAPECWCLSRGAGTGCSPCPAERACVCRRGGRSST